MKIELNAIGIISMAFGTIGAIYAIQTSKKQKEEMDKFKKDLDEVASDINLDFPANVVDLAMAKAANNACEKAASDAVAESANKIRIEAEKAVKEAYGDIKKDVQQELEKQIGRVDIEWVAQSMTNEAIEQADKLVEKEIDKIKEDAREKFDKELNRMLKEYNQTCSSISRGLNLGNGFTISLS